MDNIDLPQVDSLCWGWKRQLSDVSVLRILVHATGHQRDGGSDLGQQHGQVHEEFLRLHGSHNSPMVRARMMEGWTCRGLCFLLTSWT